MKSELSDFHKQLANAEQTTYRETKTKQFKAFIEASPAQKLGTIISVSLSTLVTAWIYSMYPLGLTALLVPGMHIGNGLLIGVLMTTLLGAVYGLVELKAINLYGSALILGALSLLLPQALSFSSFGSFLAAAAIMLTMQMTVWYLFMRWVAKLTKSELVFGFVYKKQPWLCTYKLKPLAPTDEGTPAPETQPNETE